MAPRLSRGGSVSDFDNSGTATISDGVVGDLDNGGSGQLTIEASGQVTVLANAGTASNAGEIGTLTNTGGTLANTGTVTGVSTVSGGTVDNSGTLTGNVDVAAAGTLNTNGTVGGTIDNDGTVTVGGGTVAGLNNTSTATVNDGVVAALTNSGTGQLVINTNGNVTTLSNAGTASNAGTVGALTNSDGTFTNTGSVTGDATISGGSVTNSNTIAGATVLSGGSLDNSGTLGGAVTNSATLVSTGTINGDLTNQGNATASLSGTVSGAITTQDSASVTVNGDLDSVTSITHGGSGTFAINSGTTTLAGAGTVTNSGSFTLTSATLDATGDAVFANTGFANLSIGAGGNLDMDLNNDGTVQIADGGSVGGTLQNGSGGSVNLDGSVGGDLSNAGTLDLSGSVAGTLGNTGTLTVDGASTVTGTLTNAGSMFVNDTLAHGNLTNSASGPAWSDTMLVTDAVLRVSGSGALTSGTLTNSSSIGLSDGATITSAVINSGTIIADGNVTGAGDFTHQTGAILDLGDDAGDDVFVIAGDAVLNGTIELDITLEGEELVGDQIQVAGAVSGNATFNFNLTDADAVDLLGTVNVLSYGSGQLDSYSVNGLPNSGAAVFALVNNTDADAYQLQSGANPAVGGLATGLALTQSLIGSVVNRPTSPFVTGLAVPGDEPCGFGTWSRATGGRATASGSSETALGTYNSELTASYHGMQIGADYSCFGGAFNGWDLSFGGVAGYNGGTTTQPVYFFDANTGQVNTDVLTSTNRTSFSQSYGSAYIAASRSFASSGRVLFADVQVRGDKTAFDLDNSVNATALDAVRTLTGDATLTAEDLSFGVKDQSYDSKGVTIGASAGLSIPLNEAKDLRLVPTLGFSLANIETDTLYFSNGELEIEDIESRVGFAGLTLAKTKIAPSGTAAFNYFATATVYHDFGSPAVSNFYLYESGTTDRSGDVLSSSSSNLGTYGELSLGMNFTKILQPGSAMPGRQLDTSVRLDSRFSDKLDSWGLTAQFRIQF